MGLELLWVHSGSLRGRLARGQKSCPIHGTKMVEVTNDDSGSFDSCGRNVLGGIDRPRLRLDPDAGVSMVVSKLQEGRLNQPISSC